MQLSRFHVEMVFQYVPITLLLPSTTKLTTQILTYADLYMYSSCVSSSIYQNLAEAATRSHQKQAGHKMGLP